MLARRVDQENLVHAQQTAGAAKPLNRALGAKTPGNRAPKTPFKANRNDENAVQAGKSGLKTLGKGNENLLTIGGKAGPANKNAFVTPAGPRTRAPLGFKTTNAKANAFQTPGANPSPEKTQQKTLSPRLRRAKVKVHHEEIAPPVDDDGDEIEYMPPRSVPLPDIPSDDEIFGPGKEFPQFAPENFARGWAERYLDPLDDNGVSIKAQKVAEDKKKADKLMDEIMNKAVEDCFEDIECSLQEELGISPRKKKAAPEATHRTTKPASALPLKKSTLGTVTAKSAASALSHPPPTTTPAQTQTPSYAQPTAAAASRAPSGGLFARKIRESAKADPAFTGRHETALVASRSTVGYGRGRAVSQNLRKPVTAAFDRDFRQRRVASATAASPAGPRTALERTWEVEEGLRLDELEFGADEVVCGIKGLGIEDEFEEFEIEVPSLG